MNAIVRSIAGDWRRIGAFAFVGGGATALYAFLAWLLIDRLQSPPLLSSAAAYGCAAAWSFAGHRWLTFASKGSPIIEAPRFFVLTIGGVIVSGGVMKAVTIIGLPTWFGIVLVVGLIPLVNYLILKFWVFNVPSARQIARPEPCNE